MSIWCRISLSNNCRCKPRPTRYWEGHFITFSIGCDVITPGPIETWKAELAYTYFFISGHESLHILQKTSFFTSLQSVMIAEPISALETFANMKLIEIWQVEMTSHLEIFITPTYIIQIFSNFAMITRINPFHDAEWNLPNPMVYLDLRLSAIWAIHRWMKICFFIFLRLAGRRILLRNMQLLLRNATCGSGNCQAQFKSDSSKCSTPVVRGSF